MRGAVQGRHSVRDGERGHHHTFNSVNLLSLQSPSEAEAQCAALCKAGAVYAMASEDMDSLTFATPRLTRNLLSPASAKLPVTEYDFERVREMIYSSENLMY